MTTESAEACQASTGADRYKLLDSPIVMSQFSYWDDISSICPTSNGHAWLCDFKTNKVNLINNMGQVLQTIQHESNINDISQDPTTGRLWFCCCNERTICNVSTSSSTVTRFTTEGYPQRLCVTREGSVVVGTHFKVVMYTAGGQVLHTASSGHASVLSITQCAATGNIAVQFNHLMSGYGIISVYNQSLQPLANVRGDGCPIKVAYDSKGNIIRADRGRKTIELLSGAGKYIKTLHTNESFQEAVAVQEGDVLWSRTEIDTGEWGLKLLKYYSD